MPYILIFLGFLSVVPVAFVFILGFAGEYNGAADYIAMAVRQAVVLVIFGMIPSSLIYGGYQRLKAADENQSSDKSNIPRARL